MSFLKPVTPAFYSLSLLKPVFSGFKSLSFLNLISNWFEKRGHFSRFLLFVSYQTNFPSFLPLVSSQPISKASYSLLHKFIVVSNQFPQFSTSSQINYLSFLPVSCSSVLCTTSIQYQLTKMQYAKVRSGTTTFCGKKSFHERQNYKNDFLKA